MRIRRYLSYFAAGAVLLALSSCKTTESKPVSATPPPQANAPTIVAPADPAPQPEPKPKPLSQLAVDPVEALLNAAEKEYRAGLANYNAGHLEAAKDNFDRAFDLLLESNLDVHGTPRLQAEFEKIVEGTHQLELQALQAGDGFSEQKPEPAPIDEANAVTFAADPNVKAKAEAELRQTRSDLPLVMNDYVAGYIAYFSSRGRGTLERALVRAGRYKEMISRILREEGVPQDLIYLAQAESGFHPLALSRVGARGMWQFMASRASGYDLTRNWWVDERQDPEKATRAAARHLKDLYQQFGDWYLAMAAYNSGPGTVQSAVQRTGYADFWELYKRGVLPKETKNYVPIIVAVTIMAKNPAQYGLDHLELDQPQPVDHVEINYPVDLRLVAECVDSTVAALQELNPSLLRMTTPKEGSFELTLPAGTADKFQTAIAAIPKDKRVWWRYHTVGSGETLAQIARQYRTTVAAITEVNSLPDGELPADSKLIIPVTPGKREMAEEQGMVFSKRATRYKVRRGDTVLSVADDFGVPADRLRRWNGLKSNKLVAGRILRIYRPVAASAGDASPSRGAAKSKKKGTLHASAGQKVLHKVKPGETLYSIANSYNTTVANLLRDNSHLSSILHPGDVVVVRAP